MRGDLFTKWRDLFTKWRDLLSYEVWEREENMEEEEKKKRRLNNAGFSLIELIIVVAIMAILAAALAPQLIKYIEKSRANTCRHNMGLIEEAITLEYTDKREAYTNYGTITDLENVELYDGTKCPSGGTYSIEVTQKDDGGIDIDCSKHGKFTH